jgi:hypothetical protein
MRLHRHRPASSFSTSGAGTDLIEALPPLDHRGSEAANGGRPMPKTIKGNAGRRPPEPSADHSAIEDWCVGLVPYLQPIITELDALIREVVPEVHFGVKWKRAFYGLADLGWIIELAPYDVSANVVFYGGADLEPPPPLGTTDRTRYVKITSMADVQRQELRAWIGQAGRTPGWR